MNRAARYGYFPRWPQDGDAWLHPEDVAAARRMIPSARIFRQQGEVGGYRVLWYGEVALRAFPALWQEVAWEGLQIGDWVEVRSHGGRQRPHTGVICEMLWDARAEAICYRIRERGRPLPKCFFVDDLIAIEPCPE